MSGLGIGQNEKKDKYKILTKNKYVNGGKIFIIQNYKAIKTTKKKKIKKNIHIDI